MEQAWCPDRGDIIRLSFTPQAGFELAGRRPALVLSPGLYNRKVGLVPVCTITTRIKGYPYEVQLPTGCGKSTSPVLRGALKSHCMVEYCYTLHNRKRIATGNTKHT